MLEKAPPQTSVPWVKQAWFGWIVVLIPTLAILGMAIYAHIQNIQATIDYRGSLAIWDRVFDLALACSLLLLAFSLGRSLSKIIKLEFAGLIEEASISILLGTGTLGLSLLGIAFLGWLRPVPVILLLAVLVLFSFSGIKRLGGMIKDAGQSIAASYRAMAVVAGFLILFALLILRALTPPYSPDELIYHLPVTQSFIERGRIYPVYDNFSGNLPFLIQMIYAVCLMAKADIAAKVFSLLIALTGALALYAFCARLLNRQAGLIALFGFFASGMVIEVAVTSRIDASLAVMLFAATYALIVWLETRQKGWLYASAVLSGFSLGIKYTAGVWLALFGVMFLVESLRKREAFLAIIKHGLIFSVIALAVASPWYLKNAIWFHNPVYPFFTGEVASAEGEPIRYFTPEDERRIESYQELARKEMPEVIAAQEKALSEAAAQKPARHPLRFWEYFSKPDNYNMAEPRQSPNYLFLIIPLILLCRRNRWVLWLLGLSAAFFCFSASTSWIARYLLPIYPPLTVVAAYTLTDLADRLRRIVSFSTWVPASIVAILLIIVLLKSDKEITERRTYDFLQGTYSRREFLMASTGHYQLIDLLDRELPLGSKVLMIGHQLNYGLHQPAIADVSWNTTEWRRLLARAQSLDEVHATLKQRGITHIVFYPDLYAFAAMMGREGSGPSATTFSGKRNGNAGNKQLPDYYIQIQNWASFELYRRKHLQPVFGNDALFGFKVLRLN